MAGRRIPHFPIWVDDTLAYLQENPEPTIATGARFRLWLVAYRRGGRLRDDDKWLATWSGLSLRDWRRVREYVVSGWEYDAESKTFLIHRLAQEIERQNDLSAKAKANAEARWNACDRNAPAMRPHAIGNAECDRIRNASPPLPSKSLKKSSSDTSRIETTGPPGMSVDKSEDSSPRASAREESEPNGNPEPPVRPALNAEEGERLDGFRSRILDSKELAGHLGSIDRVIVAQLRRGAPCSAIEQGLASVLEHKPREPAAYLAKVLRIEVPNHHEAAAIARHGALKQAEARARSAPTTAAAHAEMEQLGGPLAAVLGSLASKVHNDSK